MTTLAREVKARGHDVAYICLPDAESFVRAAGLTFLPCGEDVWPAGSVVEFMGRLGKLELDAALQLTIEALASVTEAMLRSVPTILVAEGVDGVVLDTYDFYREVIPLSLGLPYVHVSNALHFDYSGYTPLCVYGWPHRATPAALARNRQGVARFAQMLKRANAPVRAYAEHAGIEIDWENPGSTISELAWITQTPKEFDFESSDRPPQFHHTGPFHDGNGRIPADFPWERLTGEPLIYGSMGTIQNGLVDIFSAIAATAAQRKGCQLVLSIGPFLDPKQIRPVSGNTVIVQHAPQLELLKRASACITHAGLNTVLEALAQGVPQVAIPVTNDQPGVAARIAEKRTGTVVPLKELTASRLSASLDQVLDDAIYRDNARYFQKVIAEANGLSKAADLVEQAFGATRFARIANSRSV
jgi:zeaxanthin glucosyltransferase